MKGPVVPSPDLGARPEMCWIDKTLIDVDRRYQREISRTGITHINGILRDFQWKYFQVVTVTPTKGDRYNAIDGQHRLAAAMRHPKIKDIPCVVIARIDMREQAKVFDTLNSRRIAINSLARFHAALAAGDPGAMWVDYVCSEAGIKILRTQPQGYLPELSLASPIKLLRYRKWPESLVVSVLSAMAEAWPDRINGFRAGNVGACLECAWKLAERYDKKRFVAMLRRWNEHEEFLRAYTERSEKGGILERIMSRRMGEAYGTI